CQQVVQDIKMELGNTVYNENTELCPVCFDKISNDFHRLEYCGHAYCRECILHWLQTSNDFPLSCLTCESPLVVQDIYWVTKEVKSFDVELYQKALTAFVNIRDDISYCPSPDCSMIYRTSNNDDDNNNAETVFLCPLCSNSICTQCQEFYHYGMSCNLNKLCKADSDYSLKMWLQADPNNHKSCPSCSAPIEKNGGCNHMTCWKCKCDMCWLCLQVFPNAELVYNHQANCPRQQIVQDLLTF
ncbi:e3 ubiquitin-protein ligase dbl4, partial [Caerostris darwini]